MASNSWRHKLRGAKPTVDREIQIAAAEPNACRTLHQIKYLENINPGGKPEYMNWTEFYCQIKRHQFGIFVDYFSDNGNSEALDASAFEVAKSLRVCNGSSGRESCGHDGRE